MKTRIFILSCLILFLTGINIIFVYPQEATFTQLAESYKNSLEVEERDFNKFTFNLAPKQMQMVKVERLMGLNHKFILHDNQGGYWIFKPESNEIKSVCLYKIFKLLGLDTPQMFWLNLKINGKSVSGSIQRFIVGAKTLENVDPIQLNEESLDYLLKTYVLQWFFANYDSEPRHFLLFEKDNIKKIMKIDNTSCLSLLGKDKLDLAFFPPYWRSYKTSYYYKMWEKFINDKIKLDLRQNFIFIKFLENIPDEIIIELISPALRYEFPHPDSISSYLIKRKHRLFKDFISFYSKIMSQKNSELTLPSHREIEMGIEKIIINCIKKFKKDIFTEDTTSNYQVSNYSIENNNIVVIASIKGWEVIKSRILVYKIMGKNKGIISLEEYYKMLDELSSLKKNSDNYEKMALDYYIQEVKSLIENKKNITEIERIIKLP